MLVGYFNFCFLVFILLVDLPNVLAQPMASLKQDSGSTAFFQAKILKNKILVPVPENFERVYKKSASKCYSVKKRADVVMYRHKDGSELCYYFTSMRWDDSEYCIKIWDTAAKLAHDNYEDYRWSKSGWEEVGNRYIFFIQLRENDLSSSSFVLLMFEELEGRMLFGV